MKTRNFFKKGAYLGAAALMAVMLSCQQNSLDQGLNSNVANNVQSEAITDTYQGEAQDMTSLAVNNTSETMTGRSSESSREVKGMGDIDDRFTCAVVTHTKDPNSSSVQPMGTITIDFGTGCADKRGNTRKGMIIITYSGRRFMPGSSIITTFKDYFRNDVQVEGTHTITNIAPTLLDYPKFQIVITGGKLTFPDGRTATREQNLTREWQRGPSPLTDKWVVDGKASGTNRNGKNYTMEITKSLVYSTACRYSDKVFIPVAGVKHLVVDSKDITIDFGDGTCDNKVTITINGQSTEQTLTEKG